MYKREDPEEVPNSRNYARIVVARVDEEGAETTRHEYTIERMVPSRQAMVEGDIRALAEPWQEFSAQRAEAFKASEVLLGQLKEAEGEERDRLMDELIALTPSHEDATKSAKMTAAMEVVAGWYIMNMWADPTWALQAQERFNKRKFANRDFPAASAGAATYRELHSAGWSPDEIQTFYVKCRWVQNGGGVEGRNPTTVAARVAFFGAAPPQGGQHA